MESIFILIPIAIGFAIVAVAAFFWAVNNKQYDDLDSAGKQILFDEPGDQVTSKTQQTKQCDE